MSTTIMVLVAPRGRVAVSGGRRQDVVDAAASLHEISADEWKSRIGSADLTASAVTVAQPGPAVTR